MITSLLAALGWLLFIVLAIPVVGIILAGMIIMFVVIREGIR